MRTLVQSEHYQHRYSPEIGSVWELRPGDRGVHPKFDKVVVSSVRQPTVEVLCLDGSTYELRVSDLNWYWKKIS